MQEALQLPWLQPVDDKALRDAMCEAAPKDVEARRLGAKKRRSRKMRGGTDAGAAGAGTRHAPTRLRGKPLFWQMLLSTSYVLHCFPPGGDPAPGEKRFIFMGHPRHTHAEIAFARRQGLWRVDDGAEGRCMQ